MKTYILIGELAVSYFKDEDWEYFQDCILENHNGDIIAWNKETDNVSTLLDMLSGWDDFIELSEEDLTNIKLNTQIEIV